MKQETGYRFRTAVGGFHKGDVSKYISDTTKAYKQELETLTQQITQLEEDNRTLREQLLVQESEVEEEVIPEAPVPEYSLLELEAYRRAEAAERLANLRTKKLYMLLEGICRETDKEFNDAATVITQTAQSVMAQAAILDEACNKLKEQLAASCKQLQSMDAMVPDPSEGLED